MGTLRDAFGREFVYLRLSVTERCNFRCVYCLPGGYAAHGGMGSSGELTVDEIRRLCSAMAGLGVWKIRLTGGEPTVRQDIVDLVDAVSSVPGIRHVALTTNGYRLRDLASPLHRAGLRGVNVSVDSLDPERFAAITGAARLEHVLAGVEAALDAGIDAVKVNAVLLRDMGAPEFQRFFQFARERPVSVRFIELMRTGENAAFFERQHLRSSDALRLLEEAGWTRLPRAEGAGPAAVFGNDDARGTVGIIAPYDDKFCATCNRLRVSSRGGLRLCLFGEGEASLRSLLAHDDQRDALIDRIRDLVLGKAERHRLHEGRVGGTRHLALIGG